MIVVTGGSGVLGTSLVAALRARGEDVRVLASSQVDLRDRDAALSAIESARPSVVYHLAAKVHGLGGNARYPAEMFDDNTRINVNVIDAAHRAGARKIVAISTVAIYSSDSPRPIGEDSIWCGPPHHSESAYAHAKRGMLAQLEAYATQYGTEFVYPIMTNLYGPHDRFDLAHGHVIPSLVAKFHAAARHGGGVSVWGTGVAERDFLFAEDAAEALICAAENLSGRVNVASGQTTSIRQAVEILSAHSGVADVTWDATKPDGQLDRSYDVSRLRGAGFKVRVPVAKGLARTYDWYAAHFPNVRQ